MREAHPRRANATAARLNFSVTAITHPVTIRNPKATATNHSSRVNGPMLQQYFTQLSHPGSQSRQVETICQRIKGSNAVIVNTESTRRIR